jgi:hypothetical protein
MNAALDTLPAAEIRAHAWRAYSADTSEAEARASYQQREQRAPATVGRDQWGKVLAGPLPEEETR